MQLWPTWLKVTLSIVFIGVVVAGVVYFFGSDNSSSAASPQPGTTATTTPKSKPTPSSPPDAAACPQPKRLPGKENDFKNRVFDFEEVWLIHDPRTLVKALEERGDPKGLVSKELLEQLQEQAQQAPQEDTSEIAVLDRVQSKFSIDEGSDASAQIVYVTPVYTTCRDGKVVNDPVTGTEHMSTWTKDESPDGAYRVVEQVS